MFTERTKVALLALFAAYFVLTIGFFIALTLENTTLWQEFLDLFKTYKGWLILALAVIAGVLAWYGMTRR